MMRHAACLLALAWLMACTPTHENPSVEYGRPPAEIRAVTGHFLEATGESASFSNRKGRDVPRSNPVAGGSVELYRTLELEPFARATTNERGYFEIDNVVLTGGERILFDADGYSGFAFDLGGVWPDDPNATAIELIVELPLQECGPADRDTVSTRDQGA